MNFNVLICLILWLCVTFSIAVNHNSQDRGQRHTTASGREEKRDQLPMTIDENNPSKFQGIQADSLGENNQIPVSPSAAKETVLKELEDGGPVLEHEEARESNAKEIVGTEASDLSHYDDEEIKIVKTSSSSSRHGTPKPVRLPSLTHEGKVDTVLAKSPKSNKTMDDSRTKGFTDSAVDIFELPDSKISEDHDRHLPKSAKQLLGESDDSSPDKLRKAGEKLSAFYDNDINAVKKVVEPGMKVASPGKTRSPTPVKDPKDAKVNVRGGQIGGGQITGGNILGGNIQGGFIAGGTIMGGYVKGGRMTGGVMDGGTLMGGGSIEGGFFHNGTIKGGDVKGGNITGGIISGGVVLGGHVSGGFVAGGVLKKGGVEGGVLRGGTIDGGILKGGVMESGLLRGGTVWNGRVTGGTILGGEILGGEVGEGVTIRGGRINGTVTVGRMRGTSFPLRRHKPQKLLSIPGVQEVQSMAPAKQPPPQNNPGTTSNPVSSDASSATDAVVINSKRPKSVLLSNMTSAVDETKRTYEPKNFFRQPGASSSVSPHPAAARPNYSGGNYGRASYSNSGQATNDPLNYAATRTVPRPLAIAIPRSRPAGININQFVKQVSAGGPKSSQSKSDVRPDYHWILNQIKGGEVTGIPGKKFVARGGIRLNRASIGFDGSATFMDGGDYAETCVSDPHLCPRGLSFEMTIKVDPEATSYRDPRYILDTGASSFNSRGVALYTMDNKLRADVAVKDTAYCLQVPLAVDKWQDVVLAYNKNGELNMYINCKLVATTENNQQCISCHSPGCHTSDENTNLVLGKANHEPASSFAKFKAGDLFIYERYLTPQDIDKICGFSQEKPSPNPKNFMSAGPRWTSPVVNSNFRTGFQKSAISNPRKSPHLENIPYFSPWGSWSICSSICGSGTKVRQRSCIYTHAQSGWQTCHGVTLQAKECSVKCQEQARQTHHTTATRKTNVFRGKITNNQTEKLHNRVNLAPANATSSDTKITNLNSKEIKVDKLNDGKNSNGKVNSSRRNRIGRILSKLGTLLGKL